MVLRIGLKIKYKDKKLEVTDICSGVFKDYTGALIFYCNTETGEIKVRTQEDFIKKFNK